MTADPARTTKNVTRAPKLSSTSERGGGKSGVVIVGGGSGTFHAVESLRENGYTGGITILSKEKHPPIDRLFLALFDISWNWVYFLFATQDKIEQGPHHRKFQNRATYSC